MGDLPFAVLKAEPSTSRFRALLSEWVDNQNSNGDTPTITREKLDELRQLPTLSFMERAKRLLLFVAERTQMLGVTVDLSDPKIDARLQAVDRTEIAFIAQFLKDQGWLQGVAQLTGKGAIQADEWRRTASSSMQGFVAMWFDDSTQDAWTHGLQKGISDAGFRAARIDLKEHLNKICDEVIVEIRRSRFLVADFTGHRGGVYFEAGFAAGRELPVIWTCRKDDMKNLHFDVRQYNCIDWSTPQELASRLQKRIEATIGQGPLKVPR